MKTNFKIKILIHMTKTGAILLLFKMLWEDKNEKGNY